MSTPSVAERFDPRLPDFTAQRFALLAQLRADAPVTFLPALHVWAVTRWQEVRDVLGNPADFVSSEAYSAAVHLAPEALQILPLSSPLFALSIINVDGTQHARLREPLMAAFSPKRIESLASTVAADIDDLLASLAESGPDADLMAAFCKPLPLQTICRLFGIPLADAEQLRGWSDAFIAFQIPGLPVEAQVGAAYGLRSLEAYLRAMIVEKAAAPDDGLISALVAARAARENDLSDDELVADIASVFFAGHETTINTLGNAFHSLLSQRDQWEAVASGAANADTLTDELLRHDTSVMGLYRRAAADTQIGGVSIPEGATLWVSYGAANRDPAKFDDPETLRGDRENARQHLAFGAGQHYCIGASLARLQIREAVTRTAQRFPAMRLAPGAFVPEIPHHALRAPIMLSVVLA